MKTLLKQSSLISDSKAAQNRTHDVRKPDLKYKRLYKGYKIDLCELIVTAGNCVI